LDAYGRFHDAGTLGMGVTGPNGESLALTAAHVVGSLSAAHGSQPTEVLLTQNIAPGSGDPRLGIVTDSHPEEPCEEIEIDASLFRLDNEVETGNVLRETPMSGRPVDLDQIQDEIPVYKRGMTTPHLTSGLLDPDVRSLKVLAPRAGCDREYVRGFYVYGADPNAPFAKPGDSGAIVVNDEDRIVGMVVAVKLTNPRSRTPEPDDPAFVVAMTDILAALDFRLPGPDR
jgi:Trypsin